MARESVGEKLAHIAEQEKLPATQVRQRVSRMRRFMKRQWAAELAAVAAIVILALVAWRLLRKPEPVAHPEPDVVPDVVREPVSPTIEQAKKLRAEATEACDREDWRGCLDKLDEAAELDPEGAKAAGVVELRKRAEDALLAPPPEEQKTDDSDGKLEKQAPSPTTSSTPIKTAPVPATPPTPKQPSFKKPQPSFKKGKNTSIPSTSDGFDFDSSDVPSKK
jgi:hypothetical protein